MSFDGWSTILVLGGIRSGKSAFAESLVASGKPVRYLATAATGADDPEWAARLAAHQARRPQDWITEELAGDPGRLATLIAEAEPDDTLVVDDLGGWITEQLNLGVDSLAVAVRDLAAAVRASAGRTIVVSPEVGLSVVPPTALGRAFADEIGVANQALAEACDAVVLVVAGQPTWIKRPPPGKTLPAQVLQEPTQTLPALSTGMVIQPGMDLPMPDEGAAAQARNRLRRLDLPGAGFGALAATVAFAAATQGNPIPAAWQAVRVLLLHGDHEGAASAGDAPAEAERRAREARAGDGVLAALAAESKATVQVVDVPAGRPLDIEDALTAVEVDQALAYGWRLAEDAADAGVEVLVLGACGAGTETAAAAVTSAITGTEVVALLARVTAPDGRFDDGAWIARCAAIRDGLQRTRSRPRSAHDLLAALGGGDIAVATGILLGAASRRTPVLLDGPVGVAAALASRDIGGQARHWCLLPDDGGHPTVRHAAGVLDLVPVLDLRLGLGEGATALAALPLLRTMIGIAGTLPIHPALREDGPDPAPELGD